MAFSGSAFGGVKPAATFGGFGSTTGAGGLFGGATNQQTSGTGTTSVFGSTQSTQPAQNNSAFGTFGQPTQANQPQAGGIFGQTQQQQGTSLFGATNQTTQPSTGLFGQSAQQQQPSASIFGQINQQKPVTSIFGQSQQQSQQPTSTSIFGQQTGNMGSGLFGASNQPSSGSNLFGQGAQSTFGKSASTQPQQNLFGGNAGANFATSAGNTVSASPHLPFSRTTKFNDLPDDIKKIFEQIDTHIQSRIHIANDLKSRRLGKEIESTSSLIRSNYHRTQEISQTLEQDARMTDHLKVKLDQSVQDTIAATRLVEGFRNQHVSGMYLKNYASFPLEFFTQVANELKEKLEWFRSVIEQIERKLVLCASRSQYTPQAITSTLQNQHRTFVRLANKTAELDAEIEDMKITYREIYRAKTGSKRDPFEGGISVLDIS